MHRGVQETNGGILWKCPENSFGAIIILMAHLTLSLQLFVIALWSSPGLRLPRDQSYLPPSHQEADREDDPVIWRDWIGLFSRSDLSRGWWLNW